VFVTATVLDAGLLPPCTALKETDWGETDKTCVAAFKENAPTMPPPVKLLQDPA
jgi:hypothetical protein